MSTSKSKMGDKENSTNVGGSRFVVLNEEMDEDLAMGRIQPQTGTQGKVSASKVLSKI